jgi:predicted small integral membrane protein
LPHEAFSILASGALMTLRISKILLVFAVAIYYSLVVFNNITDYGSNYQFVRHVMMMDSTFPGNRGMWRAVNSPAWHTAFYVAIIAWEIVTALLCWWGGLRLAGTVRGTAPAFNRAKGVTIAALTLALLMWLVAFISVGGEWFLMWQSKAWNGEGTPFRMFTVIGIALLFVAQPETDGQP